MRSLAAATSLALIFALSAAAPEDARAADPPAPAPAAGAPAAAEAGAQDDTQRADALFEEGRALMASGDNEAACTKLEESQAIRPGIGTLFNLADCHEKIGKLVIAYREFSEVVERTKVALQADREKIARERLAALEARVARVIVVVPDDARDATVELDGQPLPAAAWGVAQPLEPGEHVVSAKRAKKKPFEQRFTVAAGEAPTSITIGEEGASSGGKRSTGLIVTGSILMGVGVIGTLVGGYQLQNEGDGTRGLAVGIGGLACLGVGIPLFVIGMKKKPVSEPAAQAAALETMEPGPVPALEIGLGAASASWRF